MLCKRCGSDLKDGWEFCPKCGARKNGDPAEIMGRDVFSQLLEGFKGQLKDFNETGNAPGRETGNGSGSQDFAKKRIFGPLKIHVTARRKRPGPAAPGSEHARGEYETNERHENEKPEKVPRVTVEPPVRLKRLARGLAMDIDMPDVKSGKDIRIRELGSSVEVKATAGQKGYFRIMEKPQNCRLTSHYFRDGSLHLEFS